MIKHIFSDNFFKPQKKPNLQKEIVAIYRVASDLPLKEAAAAVAVESSIGTWTPLAALKPALINLLGAWVYEVNKKTHLVKIAYPLALFELGNISQLLSSVAGNVFGLKEIKWLRLIDILFPAKYIKSFKGPRYGIKGVRQILKIKNRPIIGAIIKPKLGLKSVENARVAYEVWTNGVDLVKDDENLTSQSFNKFARRVSEVLKMRRRAEKETGHKKVYAFNVTSRPDTMLKRAQLIKKFGGRCAMIDILACGLDNVDYLRRANLGLIIHGHRAGHAALTRSPYHGISMLVWAKLSRLTGVDQLHTGTVVGKMEGSVQEVLGLNRFLREGWHDLNFLAENWSTVKPILPIASGGLHPGLVPKLIQILGQDLIINFGGGIHGHPEGSSAGARAVRQALEAAVKKTSLKNYARSHRELKIALDYWGE